MSAFGGITGPEEWSAAEADWHFNVYRESDRQDRLDTGTPLSWDPEEPVGGAHDPMTPLCWCGERATTLVDSDSWPYRDGQPVCDEHAEGRDPAETSINYEAIQPGRKK